MEVFNYFISQNSVYLTLHYLQLNWYVWGTKKNSWTKQWNQTTKESKSIFFSNKTKQKINHLATCNSQTDSLRKQTPWLQFHKPHIHIYYFYERLGYYLHDHSFICSFILISYWYVLSKVQYHNQTKYKINAGGFLLYMSI